MKGHIKKCANCGKYTLKTVCPVCNLETISPHPHRFSPEDRFGKYRRALKKGAENTQTM
jgi:H/ACA ribonucleoprotein complex subunit 3